MTLDDALNILADFHTRDDDVAGFRVHKMGIYGAHWSPSDYIEAWKTVRAYLHRSVEPGEQDQ